MAQRSIICGINPVREALQSRATRVRKIVVAQGRGGKSLEQILKLAQEKGVPVSFDTREKVGQLASLKAHQGVVGLVAPLEFVGLEDIAKRAEERNEPPLMLVLDHIQDPHNFGSLLRTAAGLGVHGVVTGKDRSCPLTPAVYKASAGGVEHLLLAQVANLAHALTLLKKQGIWIAGADAKSPVLLSQWDFTLPTALVLGSEGKGLSRLMAEKCDQLVAVPMPGPLSSLNVAVAGAICLYEAVRQRSLAGQKKSPP